jgi:hypothetical protein
MSIAREKKQSKVLLDLIIKLKDCNNKKMLSQAANLTVLYLRLNKVIPPETCNLILGRKKPWPTKRSAIKKRIKQLEEIKDAENMVSETLESIWSQERK